MGTIYQEIEIDLADFDTDDLVVELEDRGFTVVKDLVTTEGGHAAMERIYQKFQQNQDYSEDVRQLIWETLGRIV